MAFGGTLTSGGDEDFKPGGTYLGAALSFWHDDNATIAAGSKFVISYGVDVGQGVVTSIDSLT